MSRSARRRWRSRRSALVATIAARRRRSALALVRGRGATLGQIVRAVFLEGCVVAIPALAVAILLAIAPHPRVGSDRATVAAATVVAAMAVGLLIVTALPGTTAGSRPDGPRRRPEPARSSPPGGSSSISS